MKVKNALFFCSLIKILLNHLLIDDILINYALKYNSNWRT